jgi:hypothetical protein
MHPEDSTGIGQAVGPNAPNRWLGKKLDLGGIPWDLSGYLKKGETIKEAEHREEDEASWQATLAERDKYQDPNMGLTEAQKQEHGYGVPSTGAVAPVEDDILPTNERGFANGGLATVQDRMASANGNEDMLTSILGDTSNAGMVGESPSQTFNMEDPGSNTMKDIQSGSKGFVNGGMVPPGVLAANGGQVQGGGGDALVQGAIAALMGKHPNPEPAIKAFVQAYGPQALEHLAKKIQSGGGGLVRGPGDGQDDAVPGVIQDSGEPVKLSDGEFIVPADAVSGLGNGSTDAGADKLQAVVDAVRRTKGANKGLPARV